MERTISRALVRFHVLCTLVSHRVPVSPVNFQSHGLLHTKPKIEMLRSHRPKLCWAPLSLQFKVMLFNDNGNTREYVSRSLVQVVGLPESVAYAIMMQVTCFLRGGATHQTSQPGTVLGPAIM